ncbi:transposable element Tcb2 transposase [Trichonephila clavipes]|uniref:Transposable element Tcb2 transposase n=1 Tax=Trichonephila clavipes TaxID=2585209 RepID=A0A8X7BDV0_TRICX|nr:transposable element Tcb2 transposase [Trichonephila clavipes]
MLIGRTELHIFDRGSVTRFAIVRRYFFPMCICSEVPLAQTSFLWMTIHGHIGLLLLKSCWKVKISLRMDWPAYSPDLNPIEHVWDGLRRRIATRLHHPANTQQLKQMLIEEWALLPQEMLNQLVLSMRRWREATTAVRGGLTPY